MTVTLGTPAAFHDIFFADCLDRDGQPVRAIIHCRSAQAIKFYLDGYAALNGWTVLNIV